MGERDALIRAVFLDRDGVINRAIVRNGRPYSPESLGEFELLPGVVEAIALSLAHSRATAGVTCIKPISPLRPFFHGLKYVSS